jgi:hypothetical protein
MGLSNGRLNSWVWSRQLQAQEEGEGNSKEAKGGGIGWKGKPSLSSSYIHTLRMLFILLEAFFCGSV